MTTSATGPSWKRVEELFHEALSKRPDEREQFLAEACLEDESLRSEVKSLLGHFQPDDEFLDQAKQPHFAGALEAENPIFKDGDKVGSYFIIRILGTGGMGEVYLARDTRLRRLVALKILPRSLAGDQKLVERLRREAHTASALNHPNILTIYEFASDGDLQYIVSEFVEGKSLRESIGKLSIAESLDFSRQIAQALQAAHGAGIIHRDIKPENVMVRPDGYVKVLDLGLAKANDPQFQNGKSLHEQVTSAGVETMPGLLVGTIGYMSPEQVRGQLVDHRTDIWSWGVVLYEMLAGKRPFEGDTPSDTLVAILDHQPELPSAHRQLSEVVFKALSKVKEERYQTTAELLESLNQVSNSIPDPGSIGPSSRQLRKLPQKMGFRPRSLIWLALGVAVIACAVGVILWWYARTPRRINTPSLAAVESYTSGQSFLHDRYDSPQRIDEAVQAFTNATTLEPSYAAAYSGLGESYLYKYLVTRQDEWKEMAQRHCEKAQALEMNEGSLSTTHGCFGVLHNGTGSYGSAVDDFSQLIQVDPQNADAYRGRATAYQRLGKTTEAEKDYRYANELDPKHWRGHSMLADLLRMVGRDEEAAGELNWAIGLRPDSGELRSSLGGIYLEMGKYDDAIRLLKQALKLSPKNYAAYENLGTAYLDKRQFDNAIKSFRQAVALNPQSSQAHGNLARAYFWSGKPMLARPAYEQAAKLARLQLKVNPKDADVRLLLAIFESMLGHEEEARNYLEQAFQLQPDAKETAFWEVIVNLQLGNRAKAMTWLPQAIRYSPAEVKAAPELDSLHDDPEFKRLMHQSQLATESKLVKKQTT